MDPNSNEIILSDEDGNLYEGLSSNFFIINPAGFIQTAPPSSILPGTVMNRICKEEWLNKFGMKIVYECPRVEEICGWRGAFITSTSRLILPIHEIVEVENKS